MSGDRPSKIVEEKGFYCFVCHAHGDKIDFLKALLGVEAFDPGASSDETIAQLAGLDPISFDR